MRQSTQYQLTQTQHRLTQTGYELDKTECLLDDTERQLDNTKYLLDEFRSALNKTERQLAETEHQLAQTKSQLDAFKSLYEETESTLDFTGNHLAQTISQLDETKYLYEETKSTLDFTKNQLAQTISLLDKCRSELSDRKKSHDESTLYSVVRVVDGDTVVLKKDNKEVKVRLIGVDTPETVHPQKQVEYYGKEASIFLTNLLKGEKVYLEYENEKQEFDKYGRLLAYLYRTPDGLFVNLEIIRQGYGHAYTEYPFKYMEPFRKQEKEAREKGKGLWSPETAKVITPTPKESPTKTKAWITRTGQKYHRESCVHITPNGIRKPDVTELDLEDAKSRGYEPCKVCKPPE